MTLDEQIAWLEQQACEQLSDAQEGELYNPGDPFRQEWTTSLRERAATLLTIENTLRAMREDVGAELQRRADDILLGRAQAFAERFNAAG